MSDELCKLINSELERLHKLLDPATKQGEWAREQIEFIYKTFMRPTYIVPVGSPNLNKPWSLW